MLNIRVLGIGQGRFIPSYRYRLKEIEKDLHQIGIDLSLYESKVSSYPPTGFLNRIVWLIKLFINRLPLIWKQKKYDLIILQREVVSTLYTFERFFYKPYIFDVDDAIHLNQKFNSVEKIAKKAKAVVVCNEYLAEYYKQFNNKVYIVPTPVNIEKYKPKEKNKNTDDFIIGWIGTSANFHSLRLIEEALNVFLEQYPNAVLKIVSNKNPFFKKIPKNRYIFKLWSEREDVNDIQSFNVGIMPLTNNLHSRGKCAFKMIQYMSCGIPVVSSCLPMNKKILENNNCGYCVEDYFNGWITSLTNIYKNKADTVAMGKRGRDIIKNDFSSKIFAKLYLDIIQNIYKDTY